MSIEVKSNKIFAACLVGCALTSVYAGKDDLDPNAGGGIPPTSVDFTPGSGTDSDPDKFTGHYHIVPAPTLSPGDLSPNHANPISGPPVIAPNPKGAPPSQNNNRKTPCGVNNTNPATSHPVIISTGEKIKTETDFAGAGLYPLGLTRYYHGFGENVARMFGSNWTSSYDYHLYPLGCDHENAGPYPKAVCIPHSYELDTPEGSFLYAKGVALNSVSYTIANSAEMGTITFNGPNTPTTIYVGYERYDFDSTGKILDIIGQGGAAQTFQYSGNNLISVTNPGNQRIQFTWNGNSVSQVTDPRGQIWTYSYNAAGMLQSVSSPDSHTTLYGYDPTYTSRLTSITVDGTKVLAVTYNTNGQVASSGTPDGEEVDSFAYGNLSTTVTNQLGDSTTFGYQSIQGGLKLASVSHLGTATCPAMAATTAYDANGWVAYTLDWRGTKTNYTYTADGRLSNMTLGAGTATPMEDVYTWTMLPGGLYLLQADAAYDTNGQLIRTTSYTYGQNAYPTSISVQDQSTGAVQSVSYGYTYASNQTLQSRTETRNLPTGAATTTYNYDSSGNLTSLTDPSGATVSYSGYDGLGRPSSMTAPNGVTHSYTYDGRGNLAKDTAYLASGAAVTTYAYDGRDNLISVSLPDGSSHNFTIAQSGRIAAQTDVAGNPATQTFTNASTIVASQGRAAAGVSGSAVTSSISGTVSSTQQLDSLGRRLNVLGNNGQHMSYGYDLNSNLTSISDALHTTTNTYDALNRLSRTTLPDSSTITYGYAPNGTLNSVLTSRGAQTTYTTNGFGVVTQRSSPDTGLTTYTVDPFGRVTQEVRANGTTVAYTYDGLDRLTSETSSGNTETFTYASSGANATHLTGISNPTGSSAFGYDGYGHVTAETDVIFGQSFGTSYSYNAAGQLTGMTYPDGLSLTYSYNSAGQVTGVSPSRTGGAVASAVYQPFGGAPYAWAYGNGASMVGSVDADGRLTSLNSVFAKAVSYNPDNTIYGISDSVYPDVTETFSYNAQSRLTGTTRSADPQSFSIDTDGNRTSSTRSGVTTTYPIANGGNKVTSWTYMGGDIYSDGTRSYTRDEFDRLATVTIAGQAVGQYRYDALDRRVYKSTSQGVSYFIYAPSGQLLYEQSAQRTVNYVWLAGRLVGISVNHGALQSVHTDWLGRPELVTGTTSPTVVWRASNAVFDRKVTLDTIGGLNIFFPGQYYDAESNLYYNWHRYYDANSGRYVQSDPIGLAGGINTYAYANSNSLLYVDPLGLDWQASIGVSATLFGLTVGVGGGGSVGLSSDGTLGGTYFFATGQANGMVGLGAYAGVGATVGVSHTGGPPSSGVSQGAYAEGDIGGGPSASVSGQIDLDGNPGAGGAAPIRIFPGAGFGVAIGAGVFQSNTAVSPSIAQMLNKLIHWISPRPSCP